MVSDILVTLSDMARNGVRYGRKAKGVERRRLNRQKGGCCDLNPSHEQSQWQKKHYPCVRLKKSLSSNIRTISRFERSLAVALCRPARWAITSSEPRRRGWVGQCPRNWGKSNCWPSSWAVRQGRWRVKRCRICLSGRKCTRSCGAKG